MFQEYCERAKSNCVSIKEIAKELEKVQSKKDIKRLREMVSRLSFQTEEALNNINEIEHQADASNFSSQRTFTTELHKKKHRRNRNTEEGRHIKRKNTPLSMPRLHNKFQEKNKSVSSSMKSLKTKEDSKENNGSNDAATYNFEDEDASKIYEELQKQMKSQTKKRSSSNYKDDHQRSSLPVFKPKSTINIFKILKDSIGKDLSKFCVPVYFNEPLSMLQRSCEFLRNEDLLHKAADTKDSLLRLVYVAAFGIAQYSGTQFRCTKPFNPILGETFEFKTKHWRYIAEQVSHHPPISAAHCKAKKWELWLNTHLRSKFYGKSMEITPLGQQKVRFKDRDEIFVFQQPMTTAQNIIIGTMYIDHRGDSY